MLLNWEICRIECRVARFVVLSVYPRLLSQMFSPSDISVRAAAAAAVVWLRAVRAVVIPAGACEQSPLTSSSRSCRATDSSSSRHCQVLAGAAADKSSRAADSTFEACLLAHKQKWEKNVGHTDNWCQNLKTEPRKDISTVNKQQPWCSSRREA